MLMSQIVLSIILLILSACSSEPKKTSPEWIHQPTRIVDNGYIVYVGVGSASGAERAQFTAEGLALEDLANECSMIPKGTRIEDRHVEREEHGATAYVKVALEFQECELMRRTLDPGEIKKLASLGFTEQLKKYQDLEETGEMPGQGEVSEVEPPDEIGPPPRRLEAWNESTHFFVVRQYVAYQKELVILSPRTAYAPGSPQSQKFLEQIQPSAQQIAGIEQKAPALRRQAWSKVPDRPRVPRPASLAPKSRPRVQELRPPPGPGKVGGRPQPNKPRRPRGKRRKFGEENNSR